MNLLLDTHAFLWFVWNHPNLSSNAMACIGAASNRRFVSAATPWEIAIKVSIGKLGITQPVEDFLREELKANSIELVPISLQHVGVVSSLPLHHRDPFDRLIVAQAITDNMTVVSNESIFDRYGVSRLW